MLPMFVQMNARLVEEGDQVQYSVVLIALSTLAFLNTLNVGEFHR